MVLSRQARRWGRCLPTYAEKSGRASRHRPGKQCFAGRLTSRRRRKENAPLAAFTRVAYTYVTTRSTPHASRALLGDHGAASSHMRAVRHARCAACALCGVHDVRHVCCAACVLCGVRAVRHVCCAPGVDQVITGTWCAWVIPAGE